jgi:hypothetical protein
MLCFPPDNPIFTARKSRLHPAEGSIHRHSQASQDLPAYTRRSGIVARDRSVVRRGSDAQTRMSLSGQGRRQHPVLSHGPQQSDNFNGTPDQHRASIQSIISVPDKQCEDGYFLDYLGNCVQGFSFNFGRRRR